MGKFRGFHVKIRAKLELFLNVGVLRVETYKTEGLICKNAKADRQVGALTRARVSEGRPIEILRPGSAERGAGRRNPPEQSCAAASSPRLVMRALQGSIRGAVWPWSTTRSCVMHWGPWRGLRGSVAALGFAAAGRRGETRRQAGALGFPGATAYPLMPKRQRRVGERLQWLESSGEGAQGGRR